MSTVHRKQDRRTPPPSAARMKTALVRVPAAAARATLASAKPWFAGVSSWRREGERQPQQYRLLSEADRASLDRARVHREMVAKGLMDQVFVLVDEIRGLKMEQHGVSFDPHEAFLTLMANVRHVLYSTDVGFVAKYAALNAARETLFQLHSAAQAIQAETEHAS